jgi:EAL domain-containing protein (putative c-di-GMP-specific phosphodiesterase class I)/ActR/RegA family two-component response regulator
MARHGDRRAISVIVADDEPHVVDYLRTVLRLDGMEVVGTAYNADDAVELVQHLRPHVALLDLRMPGGGLEAARLIGALSPETRIVIFSSQTDEDDLLPLLQAGIDGYVVKGSSNERVTEAIRAAVDGDQYLAPVVSRFAANQLAARLRAEEQDSLQVLRLRARVADAMAPTGHLIVFQPVVDLGTEEITAVEALARFTEQPLRPPEVWLSDAETSGLRVPFELALAAGALHPLPRLREELAVSVNVSPATVMSGRLREVLTGVTLGRVVLEVTEHARVNDYGALRAALAPWRAAGVRLAVDDAGAGYASFAHILNVQPEFIKLDTSLIHEIHVDRQRQALARALIAYAGEMDVAVIAEGIETQAELETIAGLGAHFGQGFHLGRPRPLSEQPHLADAVLELREPEGHTEVDLREPAHDDIDQPT